MREWTAKTGAGRRGVGAGRREVEAGRHVWELGDEGWKMGEKNVGDWLLRKLMIFNERWEKGSGK